jgi:hypothetical protein
MGPTRRQLAIDSRGDGITSRHRVATRSGPRDCRTIIRNHQVQWLTHPPNPQPKPLMAWLTKLRITTLYGDLRHWREPLSGSTMPDLFGDGRMVLTIQNEHRQPYQGIIALKGEHLAVAIEAYFTQSEQLPTRLWLFAYSQRANGLLIQSRTGSSDSEADWHRINLLASTDPRRNSSICPARSCFAGCLTKSGRGSWNLKPWCFAATVHANGSRKS